MTKMYFSVAAIYLTLIPAEKSCIFFFFNDTATTEIYTLSLHDALPIFSPTAGSDQVSPTVFSTADAVAATSPHGVHPGPVMSADPTVTQSARPCLASVSDLSKLE